MGSGSSATAGARLEKREGVELRLVDPSAALTSPGLHGGRRSCHPQRVPGENELTPSSPLLEGPSAVDALSVQKVPSPPARPPLKYAVDADSPEPPGKIAKPSDLWFRDPF